LFCRRDDCFVGVTAANCRRDDVTAMNCRVWPFHATVRSDDQATNVRRHREQLWQRLLQTTHPTGINNVNQDNIT